MALKRLSEEEMKEKLHRREEIRKIVAEKGLTDILKIDPEFMKQAEGQLSEGEPLPTQKSKWKRGANIAKIRFLQAAGSIAGASYLGANAANVGGAPNLSYGYFAGGLFGFMNSVPWAVTQGKDLAESWKESSGYERYKGVKKMIGGINGVAGNTRNMVVQSADGFAGVTWNTPGFSYTESGVNPAQLEADIAFNIINNALVALGGIDQIYESHNRKKEIRNTNTELENQMVNKIEKINSGLNDDPINEIISSLKDPKVKTGKFIPAITKMLRVVEEAQKGASDGGASEEELERLENVKVFLEDNMASFEETEKLVRTNAMAMRHANLETACGAYDLAKGSVSVAAISSRFVSSPMGGIAGLVDGLTGVVGAAALKGQFFGFEELWDNKSIIGQRNRRKAAAKEVDAVVCLCGDRNYDIKSATHQLVEDVIKKYNERNPDDSLPMNGDTKRSFASKVYYELGSEERSKAGLGNNIMLIRAAELRTAALQESSPNGPYHWCIKSLGLKSSEEELPTVDQIAQRMGCNRNWRDLVKKEEIDKKEKKLSVRQLQGAEGFGVDSTDRSLQAREQIEWGIENATEKRKKGREIFTKRVMLRTIEENAEEELAVQRLNEEELPELPEIPMHEPGAESEDSASLFKREELARQPVRRKLNESAKEDSTVQLLSIKELSKREAETGDRSKQIGHWLPEVPTHDPGEEVEVSASLFKRDEFARQVVRKKQRNTRL